MMSSSLRSMELEILMRKNGISVGQPRRSKAIKKVKRQKNNIITTLEPSRVVADKKEKERRFQVWCEEHDKKVKEERNMKKKQEERKKVERQQKQAAKEQADEQYRVWLKKKQKMLRQQQAQQMQELEEIKLELSRTSMTARVSRLRSPSKVRQKLAAASHFQLAGSETFRFEVHQEFRPGRPSIDESFLHLRRSMRPSVKVYRVAAALSAVFGTPKQDYRLWPKWKHIKSVLNPSVMDKMHSFNIEAFRQDDNKIRSIRTYLDGLLNADNEPYPSESRVVTMLLNFLVCILDFCGVDKSNLCFDMTREFRGRMRHIQAINDVRREFISELENKELTKNSRQEKAFPSPQQRQVIQGTAKKMVFDVHEAGISSQMKIVENSLSKSEATTGTTTPRKVSRLAIEKEKRESSKKEIQFQGHFQEEDGRKVTLRQKSQKIKHPHQLKKNVSPTTKKHLLYDDEKYAAAQIIQCHIRGAVCRTQLAAMHRKATKIQALCRGRHVRVSFRRLKTLEKHLYNDDAAYSSAQLIQASIRGSLCRIHLKQQHQGAIKIQSLHRGRTIRRALQCSKKGFEVGHGSLQRLSVVTDGGYESDVFETEPADTNNIEAEENSKLYQERVVKIQSMYRGHRVRRSRKRLDNNPDLERVHTLSEDDTRHVAAKMIQSRIRGSICRMSMKSHKGIVKIQAIHRGQSVRENRRDSEIAAARIQAGIRGRQSRSNFSRKKRSATKIQSLYRGRRDYQRCNAIKTQNHQATKIQAIYRGRRVRQMLSLSNVEEAEAHDYSSECFDEEFHEEEATERAARVIQAHIRGHISRSDIGKKKRNAIKIQALYRGRRARVEHRRRNLHCVSESSVSEYASDFVDESQDEFEQESTTSYDYDDDFA